jgi:hypothetical protein
VRVEEHATGTKGAFDDTLDNHPVVSQGANNASLDNTSDDMPCINHSIKN